MTTITRVSQEPKITCHWEYDLTPNLMAAIKVVLLAALENGETDPAFLEGVFSLGRCLAEVHGIPWRDISESLSDTPGFQYVVDRLQAGEYGI